MEAFLQWCNEAIEILRGYNWISVLVRLFLAVVLGSAIGVERARHGQAAGMRTHALVCLGAAMTAITGIFISELGFNGDITRIAAQVVSGIGFLGAGMIIVRGNNAIVGLTTAAGMWATAAIGIAVGYGFYTGALFATLLCLLTMIVMVKMERSKRKARKIYVELNDMHEVNSFMQSSDEIAGENLAYEVVGAKSGNTNHIGIYMHSKKSKTPHAVNFLELDGVVFALDE